MRLCAWCRGPIPADSRRDAITCSKRCRQARNRFALSVGGAPQASPTEAMRFAYADPPYPGKSARYYGEHPDFAGEVDHFELVRRLSAYDGWALSTSSAALRDVLLLCPPGTRVASWNRGDRPNHAGTIVTAWEPVIYFGARPVAAAGHVASAGASDTSRKSVTTRRVDSLVLGVTARTTDPARVVGAKPAGFIRWMFDLLGVTPIDSLDDLYPGSGGVGRAWDVFRERAV